MKDQRSSQVRTENYNSEFVHNFPDIRLTSSACKYDNPALDETINRKRKNESYLYTKKYVEIEFSGAFRSRRDFSPRSEFSAKLSRQANKIARSTLPVDSICSRLR